MAKKDKKFKLQSKDKKLTLETDSAIEATRLRAQGFRDVAEKAPGSGGAASSNSSSGKKN